MADNDDSTKGERRVAKEARRKTDRCALCEVLWHHHDTDTSHHRELVCSKITKAENILLLKADVEDLKRVEETLKTAVPWKAFAIVVTIATLAIGSIMGLAVNGQKEIKESLSTIHRRITESDNDRDQLKDSLIELKWSVNGISNRLSEVEKRLAK